MVKKKKQSIFYADVGNSGTYWILFIKHRLEKTLEVL